MIQDCVPENSLAKQLLGWQPQLTISASLEKWFFENPDRGTVPKDLETALTERGLKKGT